MNEKVPVYFFCHECCQPLDWHGDETWISEPDLVNLVKDLELQHLREHTRLDSLEMSVSRARNMTIGPKFNAVDIEPNQENSKFLEAVKLFEAFSECTTFDSPLCQKCTDNISDTIQDEIVWDNTEESRLRELQDKLRSLASIDVSSELNQFEEEEKSCKAEIIQLSKELALLQHEFDNLQDELDSLENEERDVIKDQYATARIVSSVDEQAVYAWCHPPTLNLCFPDRTISSNIIVQHIFKITYFQNTCSINGFKLSEPQSDLECQQFYHGLREIMNIVIFLARQLRFEHVYDSYESKIHDRHHLHSQIQHTSHDISPPPQSLLYHLFHHSHHEKFRWSKLEPDLEVLLHIIEKIMTFANATRGPLTFPYELDTLGTAYCVRTPGGEEIEILAPRRISLLSRRSFRSGTRWPEILNYVVQNVEYLLQELYTPINPNQDLI